MSETVECEACEEYQICHCGGPADGSGCDNHHPVTMGCMCELRRAYAAADEATEAAFGKEEDELKSPAARELRALRHAVEKEEEQLATANKLIALMTGKKAEIPVLLAATIYMIFQPDRDTNDETEALDAAAKGAFCQWFDSL